MTRILRLCAPTGTAMAAPVVTASEPVAGTAAVWLAPGLLLLLVVIGGHLFIGRLLANRTRGLLAMLEIAPFPLVLSRGSADDARQGIELVNERFRTTYGYDQAALPTLDALFTAAWPDPQERNLVLDELSRRLEEAEAGRRPMLPFETWMRCADGDLRFVEIASVRLGDRRLSIVNDHTPGRLAQEALDQERARLEDAVESLEAAVVMFDADDRLLVHNDRWRELYDFAPEFLATRPSGEAVLRDLGQRHPELRDGDVEAFVRYQLRQRDDRRHNHQQRIDGRWFALNDFTTREGGIVTLIYDVTDLKQVEERLRESQERLEFSLEAMGTYYWIDDRRAGTMTFLSSRFWKLLGYAGHDADPDVPVLRNDFIELIHPDDRPAAVAAYRTHLDGGSDVFQADFRLRRRDGDWLWIRQYAKVIARDANGQPARVSGLSIDVAREKALEAELVAARDLAEEAARAKSEFLANMSHEIRTPMNAIIGLTHLALQTELDATQRGYVEKVDNAAQSLLRIINDILDFSRIEAGQIELETTDFLLDDLLDNLGNMIGLQAEEKGLELLFDIAPDVPAALVGDPLRLTQILVNLGSNAVKFTDHGEVVVRVRLRERHADAAVLSFTVADTGIGLDDAQQERLFQAFRQADGSITRRYGGTGLGLAISRRLTELMGSTISVRSTPGRGSSFRFSARLGLQRNQPAPPHRELVGFAGEHALVVDDNDTACEILVTLLEGFGLCVSVAGRGDEALQRVRERDGDRPYALVLLDWKMPGLDGVQVARAIREIPLQHPPALMMVTAFGREQESLDGATDLFQAVVHKPVTPSALLDGVMRALKGEVLERRRPRLRDDDIATRLRGARVLLVEDNEVNRELAVDLLQQAGIEVTVASNGREALERIEASAFDGVLMDCQMPVMDGYEATRALRARNRHAILPVIAMTADAMAGDRERALAAGMNDHVTKPINVRVLFETMARWITPAHPLPAARAPDTEAFAAPEVPAIAGVDVEAGLERCQGSAPRYLRTLQRFLEHYRDFPHQIQALRREGDEAAVARTIHTLKGLAGTIGADDIAAAAIALEGERWPAPDAAFDALTSAVAGLVDDLDTRLPRASDAGAAQEAESAATDPGRSARVIATLRRLLEEYDTGARDHLDREVAAVGQVLSADVLRQIRTTLDDYDFDRARALLDAATGDREEEAPRGC